MPEQDGSPAHQRADCVGVGAAASAAAAPSITATPSITRAVLRLPIAITTPPSTSAVKRPSVPTLAPRQVQNLPSDLIRPLQTSRVPAERRGVSAVPQPDQLRVTAELRCRPGSVDERETRLR